MIQVQKVTSRDFRGIRKLELSLNKRNFAVCGPNGTGKSGVVDALEFALTGNVSRLAGEGTREISVKKHGPHVDSSKRPENARVILEVWIPSLKKTVTIDRNIKDAEHPTVTPDDPAVLSILSQVASHPEFVLSRRELIRYIISTPGKRNEEVQALLRLGHVEEVRKALNRVSNDCTRAVKPLEREKDAAKGRLVSALGIPQLQQDKLLEAVNEKRGLLGLPVIAALTAATSLKDGVAVGSRASQASRVDKSSAAKEVVNLRSAMKELSSKEALSVSSSVVQSIKKLQQANSAIEGSASRQKLLTAALMIADDSGCPVCGTAWAIDDLKKEIRNKQALLEEDAKQCAIIKKELDPVVVLLDRIGAGLRNISILGPKLDPPVDVKTLNEYGSVLSTGVTVLEAFTPLEKTLTVLDKLNEIPRDVLDVIGKLEAAVSKIPELSDLDAAKEYLTVCQDRLEAYRDASLRLKKALKQTELAEVIYLTYADASTTVLNGIYEKVQDTFSDFYRLINKDDEGGFSASLVPSLGKLGFDVDFYGKGHFPPGAYHSEGHQDAMGICLYLALMAHLLGDGFTFAVLDDVLMSVDTGHRREVCNLLKTKFPNTQFIFTTHDKIWLKHMGTVGLVAGDATISFRKWDVENGPTDWRSGDIWKEIEEAANNDDMVSASSALRHYLEYRSTELCNSLRARVEFRSDAQFQLGDLLPNATSQMSKHLKQARLAAESWGDTGKVAEAEGLGKEFSAAVQASNCEQWQMNPAIHYNEWANFKREDFIPVVDSYRTLMKQFDCEKCDGALYVVPFRGERENLRCPCGAVALNLKKK